MFLDGRQRFANPRSEFRGELAEDVQHVFLPRRRELLLVEEISGSAVFGAETEHVLRAEARNRSRDDRRAAGTDAEVARDIAGQSRAGGLPHQLERLADAFRRHDAQKRRLLELHGEPLAQRLVEHRVAGRVREIGEDDGVLVGQLRRAMQVHVAADNRLRRGPRLPLPATEPAASSEPLTAASPAAIGIDSVSRFARRRSARISDAC